MTIPNLPPGVKLEEQGTYRHVRIVGPYGVGKEVLQWVHDQHGDVMRLGPYTDRKMHPKVDMTRFLILAHIPVEQ